MMPNLAAVARPAPCARGASVTFALLLVALGVAWELWLAPTGRGTLAIKVLPLVALLPGLWRGRLRSCRWGSLLVRAYAAEGASRAYVESGVGAALAALQLAMSLTLFAALVAQVRGSAAAPAAP